MSSTTSSSSRTGPGAPLSTSLSTTDPNNAPTVTDNPSSSTSTTPTITDADASGTSNPNSSPPPSLYLFTFLATLFLLLAISSAIIMRGIFLRRRFRRRIEEAIAAGVLLSPSDDGSGLGGTRIPRRKLQRPTLYDVSVLPPYFSTSTLQNDSWHKVMPFAGIIASEKSTTEPVEETVPSTSNRGHRPIPRMLLERAGYLFPRPRLRRAATAPRTDTSISIDGSNSDSQTAAVPLKPQDLVERVAEARVAVMIAMPNPHRPGYVPPAVDEEVHQMSPGGKRKARGLDGWGEEHEEEGVPDVVFGTAQVHIGEDVAENQV